MSGTEVLGGRLAVGGWTVCVIEKGVEGSVRRWSDVHVDDVLVVAIGEKWRWKVKSLWKNNSILMAVCEWVGLVDRMC